VVEKLGRVYADHARGHVGSAILRYWAAVLYSAATINLFAPLR